MEPKLKYLETRLSYDPEQLRNFIVNSVVIFSPSIENIELKLKYFETRLSYSPEQALALLIDKTALYSCDIDRNLEPTICFFEKLLGPEEGLSLIIDNPNVLTSSLSKRLIPRRERMIAAGVSFSKPTARIMCGFSNDKFNDWIDT